MISPVSFVAWCRRVRQPIEKVLLQLLHRYRGSPLGVLPWIR